MFKPLIKDVSATFLVRIVGIVLQLAWFMLLVRLLPIESVGIYSAVNAGWILCRALGPLGLDMILLREAPKRLDDDLSWAFLKLMLVRLFALAALLFALALALTNWSVGAIGIALLGGVAYSSIGLLAAAMLAHGKPIAANAPDAIGLSLGVILLLSGMFLAGHASLTLLLGAQLGVACLVIIWYVFALRKQQARPTALLNTQARKTYQKEALAVWSNVALNNIILRVPVILAPWLIGAEQTAYLELAMRIATLLGLLHWAASYVIMPKFSAACAENDTRRLQQILSMSTLLIALPTFAGLLLLTLIGDWLITVIAGSPYLAAGSAMLVLAIGMCINASSGALAQLYNLAGHQAAAKRIYVQECLLLLLLMLIIAPLYGVFGMACIISAMLLFRNLQLNRHLYPLMKLHPPLYSKGGWRSLRQLKG